MGLCPPACSSLLPGGSLSHKETRYWEGAQAPTRRPAAWADLARISASYPCVARFGLKCGPAGSLRFLTSPSQRLQSPRPGRNTSDLPSRAQWHFHSAGWRDSPRRQGVYQRSRRDVSDPSAGSPTETLLRLLLPLNDTVWTSFREPAQNGRSRGPRRPQSEALTKSFNR